MQQFANSCIKKLLPVIIDFATNISHPIIYVYSMPQTSHDTYEQDQSHTCFIIYFIYLTYSGFVMDAAVKSAGILTKWHLKVNKLPSEIIKDKSSWKVNKEWIFIMSCDNGVISEVS